MNTESPTDTLPSAAGGLRSEIPNRRREMALRNYAHQGPVRSSVFVWNNAPFQDFRAQQNLLIRQI